MPSKDDEKKAAELRKKLDAMRKSVQTQAQAAKAAATAKLPAAAKLPALDAGLDGELPDLTPGLD